MTTNLRVLITAEHSSLKFGGEAALPLHYFRVLRARGIEAWLVTHARTHDELLSIFPNDHERIFFVPDTIFHRLLWRCHRFLPDRIASFSIGFVQRIISQLIQRKIIRRLVQEKNISIIHQPIPVSPKEPSLIFGLGAPVVIGPMNGGMDFPPAFRDMQNHWISIFTEASRTLSHVLNFIMPGKRHAALLLVANERTRLALPRGTRAPVMQLVENGVDLSLWRPVSHKTEQPRVTRYIFMGRLVALKAVDLLLEAFKDAAVKTKITLTIVGDGPERSRLEQIAREIRATQTSDDPGSAVEFTGWLPQTECADRLRCSDALILPSLMECGGAVVLEAMAMGIPVIATNWGGPADYLDSSCGILVQPKSQTEFIAGLSSAMVKLAESSAQRIAMGIAGQKKIAQEFDWEVKTDYMLQIYEKITQSNLMQDKNSRA